MTSPQTIREIARLRLKESAIRCKNDLLDGAFYLAGYSIELALKAKICERFDVPNLFVENSGGQGNSGDIWKIGDIRKVVKIHNLYQLLVYSGLKAKFDRDRATNKSLLKANSILFGRWNENCRYLPIGTMKSKREMETLILSLDDINGSGLLTWIDQN